jgi:7,8-dihydropterin-6-yl-methyl-4-(beta-D-ribofuranosyl)aminobenzene 5'-phosphate synthase
MSDSVSAPRITILVDNKANEGLLAEHGFSARIEVDGQRLLFDTGQGPALAANVGRLGVDLSSLDALVLSHGHYDHTGGVPLVLTSAPHVHVYCHPAAQSRRFAIRNGAARAIDMPASTMQALAGVLPECLHGVTGPMEIAPGMGLTGPIPRLTDYEDVGGPFFVDVQGKQSDLIMDDLALWIRTAKGLVVVVGCSHAGLINTLHYTRQLSGMSHIHAVLGGFHLGEASEARLERTMDALGELGLDWLVPCHCTGDLAVEKLRQGLGERVQVGSAGSKHIFGETKTA